MIVKIVDIIKVCSIINNANELITNFPGVETMETAKLFEFQLTSIKQWLRFANNDEIEDAVLKKYNVFRIEELAAKDYENVIDFIQENYRR